MLFDVGEDAFAESGSVERVIAQTNEAAGAAPATITETNGALTVTEATSKGMIKGEVRIRFGMLGNKAAEHVRLSWNAMKVDGGDPAPVLRGSDIFHVLGFPATPALLHAIRGEYMHIVFGGTPPTGAFVFAVDGYAFAFEALYTTEQRLRDEVLPYVNPMQRSDTIDYEFRDIVVGTANARGILLRDEPVFLYGFPDTETLIIAGSTDAYLRAYAMWREKEK